MATFLIIILFVSLFHFIYEGILLPTIRLRLRYKFFELRDELRELKSHQGDNLDDKIFDYMQLSINSAINILPNINLGFLYSVEKEIKNDPELRDRIEQRKADIENCKIEEIKTIRRKNFALLAEVFLFNSGGWFIYLVPIALIVVGFSTFKQLIKDIAFLPEKRSYKLLQDLHYIT